MRAGWCRAPYLECVRSLEPRKEKMTKRKLDRALMVSYLGRVGVRIPAKAGDDEIAALLTKYTEKHVPKDRHVECSDCGRTSDIDAGDNCPYCGSGDEAPAEEPDDETDDEGDSVPPAPPARKPQALVLLAPPSDEPEDVERQIVECRADGTVEVVPDLTGLTEADLDRDLAEIAKHRSGAHVTYWRWAKAVLDLYDGRRYTLRTDGEGRPKYRSWQQFVVAELSISVAAAYKLIEIAKNFTEEDVLRFGATKLSLVATVAPEYRKALLEATVGMSTREAAETTRAVREEVGGVERTASAELGGPGMRGGSAAAEASAKARAGKSAITCVFSNGRTVLDCYRAGAPDRRASQPAHDPIAVEQLENGVVVTYRILQGPAGLQLAIERSREDSGVARTAAVRSVVEKGAKSARVAKPSGKGGKGKAKK